MLERDSGVELSRATLDDWVPKVGELVIPMALAMRQELLRGTYIQADETPVDVQMHESRGKNHPARRSVSRRMSHQTTVANTSTASPHTASRGAAFGSSIEGRLSTDGLLQIRPI
jgi:hypothetical protein